MQKWLYSVLLHVALFCLLFLLFSYNYEDSRLKNQSNIYITFEQSPSVEMQPVKDLTFEYQQTTPLIQLNQQPVSENFTLYQLQEPQKTPALLPILHHQQCYSKKWHKRLPKSDKKTHPPIILKGNPLPKYPYLARINNYEGLVILKIKVSADGRCAGISIVKSSGYKILDKAAVEAVKKWRFIPSMKNGKPVWGEKEIRIRFKLI
jgi:protein TonB